MERVIPNVDGKFSAIRRKPHAMEATMLKNPVKQRNREVKFATEYRDLQRTVSRLRGEPPPPCCYCATTQIWRCACTGRECSVFTRYCFDNSKKEF